MIIPRFGQRQTAPPQKTPAESAVERALTPRPRAVQRTPAAVPTGPQGSWRASEAFLLAEWNEDQHPRDEHGRFGEGGGGGGAKPEPKAPKPWDDRATEIAKQVGPAPESVKTYPVYDKQHDRSVRVTVPENDPSEPSRETADRAKLAGPLPPGAIRDQGGQGIHGWLPEHDVSPGDLARGPGPSEAPQDPDAVARRNEEIAKYERTGAGILNRGQGLYEKERYRAGGRGEWPDWDKLTNRAREEYNQAHDAKGDRLAHLQKNAAQNVAKSQAAYKETHAKVQAELKRIGDGLAKHAKAAAKAGGAAWGHQGDLGGMLEGLKDFADRLHGTGEYAPVSHALPPGFGPDRRPPTGPEKAAMQRPRNRHGKFQ